MDYDQICYQKSCLSQVIIRVDFLEFIENNILFDSSVEKEVIKHFPKKGMQQLLRFQTMNVIADSNGARTEKSTRDGIQQEFSDTNNNKIILSNKFIVFEINKYIKYEDVLGVFLPVFRTLYSNSKFTSMRTGIRYINFFNEESIKPQKNYFTNSVGSLLDSKQADNKCIRSMAMNEYIIGDMHLNFRYGMYNPQYPQAMKKTNYVLDYDCFCDEAVVGYETILGHINEGHDSIQRLFENSITDQLRKVMGNG